MIQDTNVKKGKGKPGLRSGNKDTKPGPVEVIKSEEVGAVGTALLSAVKKEKVITPAKKTAHPSGVGKVKRKVRTEAGYVKYPPVRELSDKEINEIRSKYTGVKGQLSDMAFEYNTSLLHIRKLVVGVLPEQPEKPKRVRRARGNVPPIVKKTWFQKFVFWVCEKVGCGK